MGVSTKLMLEELVKSMLEMQERDDFDMSRWISAGFSMKDIFQLYMVSCYVQLHPQATVSQLVDLGLSESRQYALFGCLSKLKKVSGIEPVRHIDGNVVHL